MCSWVVVSLQSQGGTGTVSSPGKLLGFILGSITQPRCVQWSKGTWIYPCSIFSTSLLPQWDVAVQLQIWDIYILFRNIFTTTSEGALYAAAQVFSYQQPPSSSLTSCANHGSSSGGLLFHHKCLPRLLHSGVIPPAAPVCQMHVLIWQFSPTFPCDQS